jgi:hypothetical protein
LAGVWPSEEEGAAQPGVGLDPDAAAMGFHDLAGDAQSHAGGFNLIAGQESLKHRKDLLEVPGFYSRAVVADAEQQGITFLDVAHIDFASRLAHVANGVVDQIGQDTLKRFTSSRFIACSGAVMDLAMDIAASMDEIRKKKPDIGFWEHVGSGMAVGRAVVGTMTTTLLLAYSGSYIGLLMLFMGQGIPLLSILNRGFMAAEVLNTIVGSLGVVAVAPLTALAGGLLYRTPAFAFAERDNASRPASFRPPVCEIAAADGEIY